MWFWSYVQGCGVCYPYSVANLCKASLTYLVYAVVGSDKAGVGNWGYTWKLNTVSYLHATPSRRKPVINVYFLTPRFTCEYPSYDVKLFDYTSGNFCLDNTLARK